MNIRKKLILSNMLVIIVPLAVALALFAIFVNGAGARYWGTVQNLYNDSDGIYSAQSLLRTYKRGGSLSEIKKEMSLAGYHFSIKHGDEIIYSNITGEDQKNVDEVFGDTYKDSESIIIRKGNASVIKDSFVRWDKKYEVMAIHNSSIPVQKGDSYMKRYIALYLGFIILIFVVVVVFTNSALSLWISRSIIKPLKKLSVGSEMIRDGNLDLEMNYRKKDEIGKVIDDFDEMRRHLKDSVEEQLKYEKYRKDLILGVSHDFRTPLTSIKGYVEGLRDGIADTPEKRDQYYRAIETSVGNLENLMTELTDFSRIEADGYRFDTRRIEINDFYRESAEELQNEYRKDNVTVTFTAAQERLFADIDRKEMNRVNHNLIDNSVKYRERDHSKVRISVLRKGDFAEICFKDDGPGVRNEELESIFRSFYRGDRARNRPERGSGIGLSVVKQIIKGHGGNVRAENYDGLAVIVELPLKQGGTGEKDTDSRG